MRYSIHHEDTAPVRREHNERLQLAENSESATPVVLTLATDGWSPGLYRIEVEVSDTKLGRRTMGEIELEIVPEGSP